MFFDIFIPIFFWFFLIYERLQTETKQIEEQTFEPEDLQKTWQSIMALVRKRHDILALSNGPTKENVFAPQSILGFAPFDYKDLANILTAALAILGGGLKLKGFSNCEELELEMTKEHYFAGVCFLDVVSFDYATDLQMEYNFDNDEPFNHLNYSILMPSELRTYKNHKKYVGSAWQTNTPFMALFNYSDYLEEGFVPLQAAIERSFIEYRLKSMENKAPLPEMILQPFPNLAHTEDTFVKEKNHEICMLIVFCFLFPIIRLTWRITREKVSVLIRYTNVLGARNWIHYLAWFVCGIFLMFSNAVVTAAILKLHWSAVYPAILPNTSFFAFIIFLFAYSSVAVAHCIFVAAFFSDAFLAASVAGSLWIMSAIPLLSYDYRIPLTAYTWVWMAIFPNTTLGYAMGTFVWDEISDTGFQVDQIFSRDFPYEQLNAGTAMALFFAQSTVYMIVALVCEKYRAHYLFRWQKMSRYLMASSRRRSEVLPTLQTYGVEATRVYEVEKGDKKKVATLNGLTMLYGQIQVVTEVSMELFENTITVLLGHNGSGKTSVLRMVAGVAPISQGSVYINGIDCSKNDGARFDLGVALHDHLLFDNMTIEDQIKFYSRLKGMTWKQAKLQVDKYCRAMNLTGIKRVLTKNLPLSLRHQLAVCCALAGNSRLVILDQPNYGMDLSAIRKLLELLKAEKRYRAILISTNCTNFADLIADRVAIMSRGQLKCNGNIAFLKDIYSFGGRLIIIKKPRCRVQLILEFLREYMPSITLESELGKSLTFLVPNRYTNTVGQMLDHMERQRDQLNIESYTFENISINDVFLAMGTNYASDYDPKRHWRIHNGATPSPAAAYEAFERVQPRVRNHIQTNRYLMTLRLVPYLRNKCLALGNIMLPSLYLIIMFGVYFNLHVRKRLQPVFFHPTSYDYSTTIIGKLGDLDENMQAIYDNMKQWIFWLRREHAAIDIGTQPFLDYLRELPEPMLIKLHREFLVALIFNNESIAVHYNTRAYNIVPMAVNMANNAIVRTLIDRHASIAVYFSPLDYQVPDSVVQLGSKHGTSYYYVRALCLAFLFSWNVRIYFLALERKTSLPLLLRTTGINIPEFWLCTMWFDVLLGAVGIVFAYVVTYAFQSATFYVDLVVLVIVSLFVGCMVVHSVHYLIACVVESPMTSYYAVLFYDCLGIAVFIARKHMISEPVLTDPFLYLVHPLVSIAIIGRILMYVLYLKQYCQNDDIQIVTEMVRDYDDVCNTEKLMYSERILYALGILILFTFISWVLIFLIEYNRKLLRFWIWRIADDNEENAWQDFTRAHTLNEPDDNVRTNMEVEMLTPRESHTAPLVVNHIGKNYGVRETLHRVSFVLNRNSICGILGSNASGKSMLMKVISTLKRPSYGRIRIKGIDGVQNPFGVHKHISLCPENLNFIRIFSACEIMEIYANLKGIPRQKVAAICENMAKSLGFFEFYDKILDVCSVGILKRVGFALAVMGHPDLILLDEPTAGVDPYGLLLLHNAMMRVCRHGSTVLFTSKNPAECEYFADKVLILNDGRLTVGGSIEHIFESNVYGYEVQIRMKPIKQVFQGVEHVMDFEDFDSDQRIHNKAVLRVMTIIQNTYEDSILKSVDGNLLSFFVPHHHGIASIYFTIRRKEFSNLIDSFGIHHSSLQSIYLEILDQLNMEGQ